MGDIKGIKLCCPIKDGSGYAEASRQYALAIYRKGIPITIEPVSFETARPDLGSDGFIIESLINKDIEYNVKLIILTPEHYPIYKESNVLNVGYSFWETSALHKEWPAYINNNLQLCLVPCEWNRDVYIKSGVTIPVRKVNQGVNLAEFENIPDFNIAGLGKETFMFYFISQWTERKNFAGLLKAYWASFQNNEDVALVLKTYKSSFASSEKEQLKKIILNLKYLMPMDYYPKVYLLLDLLSKEELLGVHKRGDCYVSPHTAEGWGMGAFEAGAMGNPVIITSLGGNMEFTNEENSYLIDYSWTPVSNMPFAKWYSHGVTCQWWAEPDIKQTSDYMKYVYNNREKAKEKGLLIKKNIEENFEWSKVVSTMINHIKEAL